MASQASVAVMGASSLAVDFFLLAHDPFDEGRLIVGPQVLGCGLVGGKLTDLVLSRRVRIDDGRVVPLEVAPPLDEIDAYVVEALQSQRSAHPVRMWISALEDELYEMVGDRLVARRVLQRADGGRRRGRGRQPDRFPPVELQLLAACRPQQRLEVMVRSPKGFDLASGMLLAIMSAVGADRTIAPDVDRTTLREIVAEIEDYLPTDLRAIYDAVRVVASQASLRLQQ